MDTIHTTPTPPRFAGLLNLVFGFGMLAAFVTASVLGIQWVRANGAPPAPKLLYEAQELFKPVPGHEPYGAWLHIGAYGEKAGQRLIDDFTVTVEGQELVIRAKINQDSGSPEIAGAKVGNPDK